MLPIRHAVCFSGWRSQAFGAFERRRTTVGRRCDLIFRQGVARFCLATGVAGEHDETAVSAHELPCLQPRGRHSASPLQSPYEKCGRVCVRACGCLIILLAAFAWAACRWPVEAAQRESLPSEGWRRTVDGWERRVMVGGRVGPVSAKHSSRLGTAGRLPGIALERVRLCSRSGRDGLWLPAFSAGFFCTETRPSSHY